MMPIYVLSRYVFSWHATVMLRKIREQNAFLVGKKLSLGTEHIQTQTFYNDYV